MITTQNTTSLLSCEASLNPAANIANVLYQLPFSHLGNVLSRRLVYGNDLRTGTFGPVLLTPLPNPTPPATLIIILVFCQQAVLDLGIRRRLSPLISAAIVAEGVEVSKSDVDSYCIENLLKSRLDR